MDCICEDWKEQNKPFIYCPWCGEKLQDFSHLKMKKCSWCGNMVDCNDYSNFPHFHKRDCPVREIMEVRIWDDKKR